MSALLLGLVAVIVAGFGLALLDVTIRRAEVGAAAVFLSAIVQAAFLYNDVPSLRLGGMRIGVTDMVAVIVLAAAVARCLRLRHLSRHQHWLIMLGVLLLVSLMLGIASHGVQSSINDSRQYFFFVGAALYMATFRPTADLYDRIGRIWLMAAVLMVLLACVRWLQVFAGIDLGVPAEIYGVERKIRVLDGPYAFFLAGPLILTVPFWLRRGQARWVRWLGVVLLVVLIALDRRTVWLAIFVGLAVLLLRGRRLKRRAVALVVAASIVIVLVFAGDVLARDQSPPGTVTSTGSVTWRIEGWSDLVDQLVREPGELVRRQAVRQWVRPHGGRVEDRRPTAQFLHRNDDQGGSGRVDRPDRAHRRVAAPAVEGFGRGRGTVRPQRAGPVAGHAADLVPHVGPRSRTGDRDRHRHRRCRHQRAQGRSGPARAGDPRPAASRPIGPGAQCRTQRAAGTTCYPPPTGSTSTIARGRRRGRPGG